MPALRRSTSLLWRSVFALLCFGFLSLAAIRRRAGTDGKVILGLSEHGETSIWPRTNNEEVLEHPRLKAPLRPKPETILAENADLSPSGVNKWLMDWERGLNPPHIYMPETTQQTESSHSDILKRETYGRSWACQAHTWQFGDFYGKDSRRILIPLEIILGLCGTLSVYLFWISKYCGPDAVAAAHRKRLSKLSHAEVELSARLNTLEISCMEIARLEVDSMNTTVACANHSSSGDIKKGSIEVCTSSCLQKKLAHAHKTKAETEKEVRALEKGLDHLSKPCSQEKAIGKLTNHNIFGSWITYAIGLLISTLIVGVILACLLTSMWQSCTMALPQARALLICQWILLGLLAVIFPVVAIIDTAITMARLARQSSRTQSAPGDEGSTMARTEGVRAHCGMTRQQSRPGDVDELETCPPGLLTARMQETLHVDTSNLKLIRASVASAASYETGEVSPTNTSPGFNSSREHRLTSEVPSVVSPDRNDNDRIRAGPI